MTALSTAITPAPAAIADYFSSSAISYSTHLCDEDCSYCCGPETD